MLHKNTFTKKTSKYINKKLQNHRTKNYGSQDVMMLTPLNLNDGSETIPSLCGNFDLFSGAVWSVFWGELYTSLILQFDLPIEFRSTNFWGWPFRDFGRHMDTQVVQNYLMQPLQKGVSRWFRSAKVFKSSNNVLEQKIWPEMFWFQTRYYYPMQQCLMCCQLWFI